MLEGVQLGCWRRCCWGVLLGGQFAVLVTVRAHVARLMAGCARSVSACCLGVPVTVRAHFCEIDGLVLRGMHAGDGAGAVLQD